MDLDLITTTIPLRRPLVTGGDENVGLHLLFFFLQILW